MIGLDGIHRGKRRRGSRAPDVRVAAAIYCDAAPKIAARAAEVGRIEPHLPVGGDLRGECVVAPAVRRLLRAGNRKIDRERLAGDVRVAAGIYRDRHSGVAAASAEVRRIDKHGIDHQRHIAAISGERELHSMAAGQPVAGLHHHLAAADLLVHSWARLHQIAGFGVENQIAVGRDAQRFRALVFHAHRVRIGPWRKHEIVFQPLRIAVVGDVDAGTSSGIAHAAVIRDAGYPARRIRALEVIAGSSGRLQTFHGGGRLRAGRPDTHRFGAAQGQHRALSGQKHGVVAAARHKANGGIGLPHVGFEHQRQHRPPGGDRSLRRLRPGCRIASAGESGTNT